MRQTRTIEANGDIFDIVQEGPEDAPLVMFSNSLGTRLAIWDAQAHALAGRYRVLRYDPRGFHPDSRADGDFTLELLGRDALGIMDALGCDTVHWCGISLGGAVGQWLLLNAPQRLGCVTLANTAARFGTRDGWQARIDEVRRTNTVGGADETARRLFTPAFRQARPDVVNTVRDMLATAPARAWAGCAAALRDTDLARQMAGLARPVSFIAGSDDATTPPDAVRALQQGMAGSRLVTLQAAHLSNLEQPQAFSQALLDCLDAGTPDA